MAKLEQVARELDRYMRHPLQRRVLANVLKVAREALKKRAMEVFKRPLQVSVEIRGMELNFKLGGLDEDEEKKLEDTMALFEEVAAKAITPVLMRGIEERITQIGSSR